MHSENPVRPCWVQGRILPCQLADHYVSDIIVILPNLGLQRMLWYCGSNQKLEKVPFVDLTL